MDVSLDAFRGLVGDLYAVLEHRYGEVTARHTGEEETKVGMYAALLSLLTTSLRLLRCSRLRRSRTIESLANFLECRHPAFSQVAVLQQYPPSVARTDFNQPCSPRPLTLSETDRLQLNPMWLE